MSEIENSPSTVKRVVTYRSVEDKDECRLWELQSRTTNLCFSGLRDSKVSADNLMVLRVSDVYELFSSKRGNCGGSGSGSCESEGGVHFLFFLG